LIVSMDVDSFDTAFSAVVATFNNIGPGIGAVGPVMNFGGLSPFTKIVLSFSMIFGRLEIYPMLILLGSFFKKLDLK
jgi:trk family cation uptake protein